MTQKEKAKAYDEALTKAKIHINCKGIGDTVNLCTYLFPELAESEDERIRKQCIKLIREAYSTNYEASECIAYLERQKELPFVKDVVLGLPGLYFYDGERMHFGGSPAMEENPYDFAMSQQEEKQKEQKPNIELIQKSWYMEGYHDKEFNCEPKWIIKTGEGGPRYEENPKYGQIIEQKPVEYLSKDKVYAIMSKLTTLSTSNLIPFNSPEYKKINEITSDVRSLLDYPIEQKPAEWSEEDEEMLNSCISSIEESKENRYAYKENDGDTSYDREIAWLKSLHPQPKQEWSEEDEKKITFLERLIRYNVPEGQYGWTDGHRGGFITKLEAIAILKSLRPSWKPSEAQLMALHSIIDDESDTIGNEQLKLLYNDLKKLI